MSPAEPPSDDADPRRPDYRQVAFVGLAILGLVLASFVAPALPAASVDGGGDGDDGGGEDGNVDPPDGEIGRGISPDGEGGDLERVDQTYRDCRIALDRQPTPGAEVRVRVTRNGDPVADARVLFNGESIGRTDVRGEVSGVVPYNDTLRIRVESPAFEGCEFVGDTASVAGDSISLDGSPAVVGEGAVSVASSELGAVAMPGSSLASLSTRQNENPNATVTYDVEGEIRILLLGPPYPGETVTVAAEISGVPVTDATVRVGGQTVDTTDENGRAEIPIPDDGSASVTVAVSRGEFAGSRELPVLLLRTTLEPDGPLLVPGGDATVVAAVGDGNPQGATVSVAGERVGTTDADGRHRITVPLDPTAPITVTTERQTATVSLLGLYWLPATLLTLFVAVFAALLWYIFDWRVGAIPPVATAGILSTLVVQSYFGDPWGLVTAGVLVGVVLLAGLVKWRRAVRSGAVTTGSALASVVEWVLGGALGLVGSLSSVADWLQGLLARVAGWVRSVPRSVSGLARRMAAWLAAVPGRLAAGIRSVPVSRWTVAGALGVVVAPVIGYVVWDLRGALVAGTLALLAGVGWYLRSRVGSDDVPTETSSDDASPGTTTASAAATSSREVLTLREVYRTVARTVLPDGWRTRTPAEIAAAGIDRGFPERPMRDLADAFREVEYGGRSLSSTAGERVLAAYEAVVDADDPAPAGDEADESAPRGDGA